jgi:membrane associated rhomboid family serine protease
MYALYLLGGVLERLIGSARFAAIYFVSALAGSFGALLVTPNALTAGASGAIFGMFGALLVIGRHVGANITGIAIVIGINLAISFVPLLIGLFGGAVSGPQISWQAHVGGLAVGALIGLIFARTRSARRRGLQVGLLATTTVGLLALLLLPPVIYG